MYKSLYIRQGDETYWTRGEKLAKDRGKALPVLLSDLLRKELLAVSTGEVRPATPAELLDQASELIGQAQAMLGSEET